MIAPGERKHFPTLFRGTEASIRFPCAMGRRDASPCCHERNR
jgi:hypothetical protein